MDEKVKIETPNDEVRARRVISRSNHRVTGKYPGLKSRRMHYWESPIERDAFILLDTTRNVTSLSEQPCLLRYGHDLSQIHYPDILVDTGGFLEFVEVKTDKDAASHEVSERTAYLTRALKEIGYSYRVWTESEIRANPTKLNNLRYLLHRGRKAPDRDTYEVIRRQFLQKALLSFGQFIPQRTSNRQLFKGVCHLILSGEIFTDLSVELLDSSLLSWKGV